MPEAPLTTRIEQDTLRRLKIEAAHSGWTIQALVEEALRELLEHREEARNLGRGTILGAADDRA